MYTSEERKVIAQTIIAQMGGLGKLGAMVNGRQYLILDSGVQFTFSGKRGMNKCVVKLNGSDLYDIEFWYISARKGAAVKKESYQDVYYDMLIGLFEKTTGLYLSL